MTMHGIDVSGYQSGIQVQSMPVDFVIAKATEGTGYVNSDCDRVVQLCIANGIPWGYYHFAGTKDAAAEAEYFYAKTQSYTGQGIPVLDWEGDQSVAWVNRWVARFRELSGISPMIYANPWRFNQGGVDADCARWVAAYQSSVPSLTDGSSVTMWQYTSTGRISGYSGDLDCNYFYGDAAAWAAIAGSEEDMALSDEDVQRIVDGVLNAMITNDKFNGAVSLHNRIAGIDQAVNETRDAVNVCKEQLTRTDDVSGRDTSANLYERACWLGATGKEIKELVEQ